MGGLNAKAPISKVFQVLSSFGPPLIWGTQNSIAFVVAFISHKQSKTAQKSFRRQRLITIYIQEPHLRHILSQQLQIDGNADEKEAMYGLMPHRGVAGTIFGVVGPFNTSAGQQHTCKTILGHFKVKQQHCQCVENQKRQICRTIFLPFCLFKIILMN